MQEKESFNFKEWPSEYLQLSIPGTGMLIPFPPNWMNYPSKQTFSETKSFGSIIMPINELSKEFPSTYLTVSVLKGIYQKEIDGDPNEYLREHFLGKTFEQTEKPAVDIPVLPKPPLLIVKDYLQSDLLNLENPDKDLLLPRSVYKQDVLNEETGTYYSFVFNSSIKTMETYIPVVKFMLNKAVYDPNY